MCTIQIDSIICVSICWPIIIVPFTPSNLHIFTNIIITRIINPICTTSSYTISTTSYVTTNTRLIISKPTMSITSRKESSSSTTSTITTWHFTFPIRIVPTTLIHTRISIIKERKPSSCLVLTYTFPTRITPFTRHI